MPSRVTIGTAEQAYRVFLDVPELNGYVSLSDFKSKLTVGALILLYEIKGKAIGFKVGYRLSDYEFYSWLGGVLPKYRKQGVAQKLLDYQECWVTDQGFRKLSVKSMNRYPSMLRFLIKNDYQIVSVKHYGTENERIYFQKCFS